MLKLTQSEFHSRVQASAVLVVEFALSPIPSADPHPLSPRFPEVVFARVDPVAEPGLAQMFGLAAAPALLIFREGIVLYLEPGEHSSVRTAELLARISALDLGKVREAIARERAETSVHMRRMCPAARRGSFER